MKTIEYILPEMSAADAGVFADMLAYVSEYIYKIKRSAGKVELEIEESREEEVLEKIGELRKYFDLDEVRSGREAATRILSDHRGREPAFTGNVYEELRKSGSVVKMADGAFAYTGLFLEVFRYFCSKIDAFGRSCFPGIREYEESVVYPIEEYERGHYFENFPHHIMFQSTIKNDMALLDRFSKEGSKDPELFSNSSMKKPVNVLRHAACVPIYPMLEDEMIPEDQPRYFLISGKCFRNEGANVTELSRLNEFFMKEYVCIGTLEQTLEMIARARALWEFWIETFGLNCTIETANDSFFASNYKKLKIFQLMGDSKQEFRVLIPGSGVYCAVSSSNVHRTHFTKTYNIRSGSAYCQSACFAFGIERLAYTLLSQKGTDVSKWDAGTRKEIFSRDREA